MIALLFGHCHPAALILAYYVFHPARLLPASILSDILEESIQLT